MHPTYQNSKGEDVVISEMETRHLIFAICKHSRALGGNDLDTFTEDQKKNEVKNMHAELEKRTALHSTMTKLVDSILEYDSDTFNAANEEVTRAEAEAIAYRYFSEMVGHLVEYQTVELVADGVRLLEVLDEVRAEND